MGSNMLDLLLESTTAQQTTEATAEDLPADTEEDNTAESDTAEKQTPEHDQNSEKEQSEPSLSRVSLKLDDTDYDLDLPPAIADRVKNGLLMQADYSRNKSKLSEEAKVIESQKAEYSSALADLRSKLEYEANDLHSDEMKELKEYDPEAYYKKFNAYQDKVNNFNKHLAKKNEDDKKAFEADVKKEMDSYPTVIPEWLDEKTKNEEMMMMGNYLKEKGFTDADFQKVYPAKFMAELRKAALYDRALKSGQSKRKETPPPTSKARSTNNEQKQPRTQFDIFLAQQKKS